MATIVYAFVGYIFLLLTVRVLARRPGAQMTLFEFVIVFLIGGVIILATVGKDRSITNCFLAILTACLMHRAVSYFKSRYPAFGAVVDGSPLVVLRNGHWVREALESTKIDPEDVMAAARTKGVNSIFQVKYAVLERNGSISIIKTES